MVVGGSNTVLMHRSIANAVVSCIDEVNNMREKMTSRKDNAISKAQRRREQKQKRLQQ
jgi:hypothetical protein